MFQCVELFYQGTFLGSLLDKAVSVQTVKGGLILLFSVVNYIPGTPSRVNITLYPVGLKVKYVIPVVECINIPRVAERGETSETSI